ncbi:MAG: FAD-dependent oxidoreductase [Candidatus Dependentiae bacterium]|nr:FAD-dependent oxidoreductase [Candidatus Dependentiae bacterium]
MNNNIWKKSFIAVSLLYAHCTISLSVSDMQDVYVTHRLATDTDADWVVVGAGPAGIATVGVLMDIGIDPQRIMWIDPEFNVGHLSAFPHVPSNNKTKEFIDFVNACDCFKECTSPTLEQLHAYNPEERHNLEVVIKPLVCITAHLREKIQSIEGMLTALFFDQGVWHVGTSTGQAVSAQHVVLATGSYPKTLEYNKQGIITLDKALDPEILKTLVGAEDTVGVVGGSHSAILLLKFLSELQVKHIYNFYKYPILYAVDMGTWTLHPNGIKGITAQWAREVLEKNPPANLTRIQVTDSTLPALVEQCSKVVYAIGYDRNPLPAVNGQEPIAQYNEHNGFIAPRLFGIGIAFPEQRVDPLGNQSYRIGLDSFMSYAQRLIPHWVAGDVEEQVKRSGRIQRQMNLLEKMASLFTIEAL